MNETELDFLTQVFYTNAPYDYSLEITDKRDKHYHGLCQPDAKVCVLFKPDSFKSAMFTLLHELAHARMNKGHTYLWEREFVSLLKKYKFTPDEVLNLTSQIGPAMKEWINDNA